MLNIKHYKQQHYSTLFNPRTGFFARVEDDGFPEPFWSEHGPELLDISITNWCDNDCFFCYRNSHKSGHHMTVSEYETIMLQASQMGVLQVALGGGNPNQHPDFCKILELTRNVYGIIPSYTTNGKGLSQEVVKMSSEVCGAVAVSAYPPYSLAVEAVEKFTQAGIKTNLHFILDADSIKTALSWIENPPLFLKNINAIVFLNYKPVGRQKDNRLLNKSPLIRDFFKVIQNEQLPFKAGFDSCMVSALASLTTFNTCFYDACEAARFSMYISEKLIMYPCSFMESITDGVSLNHKSLLDTWRNGSAFKLIRKQLQLMKCPTCKYIIYCKGGCPVFPEINVCGKI